MTTLTEKLSAARQSQWDAQLEMFRTLGNRALDNAEQLVALNIKASRASMEHAAGTFQQMLEANSPRDLAAIGSNVQTQWQHMLAYGRELLGIATGTRMRSWSTQPPLLLAPPAMEATPALSYTLDQAAIASTDAINVGSDIAAAAVDSGTAMAEATLYAGMQALDQARDAAQAAAAQVREAGVPAAETAHVAASATPFTAPSAEADGKAAEAGMAGAAADTALEITVPPDAIADAIVDQAISDEMPPAKAKPLAKALNKLAPKPPSAEHPIASTVPLENGDGVALPPVAPVIATAPIPVPTAPEPKPPRASRKK